MNLIKLERKTGDKIEQIQLLIEIYLLLKDVKITKSEKTILAYFCHYGISSKTEKLLYETKIIESNYTYKNIISKFNKLQFIERSGKGKYFICDNVLNSIEDKFALLVKIDNT